jgi:hypothetical protein
MVIGSALTRPQLIITVNTVVETLLTQVHEVNYPASPMETTEPAPTSWQDDVKLDHLGSEERQSVVRMLEPHRKMWDGHLGIVSATSYRIEVTAGSKPVHCQPYRAGARARSAEKEQIDHMIAEQLI